MVEIADDILTGQTQRHLAEIPGQPGLLHAEVIARLQTLQQQAMDKGFQLQVASGFRSFERQLAIWNGKAQGLRPVLDSNGCALDMAVLTPLERVHAIMRWSALPGASRHHWGTDFDIWDSAAVAADYSLQLAPEEYADNGPFEPLSRWLDQQIEAGATDFYRPYNRDRGGVAVEPWHLSCHPLAKQFSRALTPQRLATVLAAAELALKEVVLDNIDQLFERYIRIP